MRDVSHGKLLERVRRRISRSRSDGASISISIHSYILELEKVFGKMKLKKWNPHNQRL